MAGKQIQLFFFEDKDGDQRVSNTMPVFRNGGLAEPIDPATGEYPKGVTGMDICDEGRAVFGLRKPVAKGKIVRLAVTLDAVEVGEYEVKAEFKPFAPAPVRARKKA